MKKQPQSIYSIRRADIILMAGCLLAAICIGIFFILHRSEGNTAGIFCDGVKVAEIAFDQPGTGEGIKYYLVRITETGAAMEVFEDYPTLPDEENFNLLSVADGKVSMEAADCRDQICVRHRAVSAGGESIICLPHKLVVEISDHAGSSGGNAEPVRPTQNGDAREALDGVVE